MKILFRYLKENTSLIILTLSLATISTVFSLMDPMIYGQIINKVQAHLSDKEVGNIISQILGLLLAVVGVAMVSRISKNFQDYFQNVIMQKVGTKIYTDGIRHTLSLPYQDFEDKRSGETLGILQKVRTDIEKLTQSFTGIVFSAAVGLCFVIGYSVFVNWVIAPFYAITIPVIGFLSYYLSKKIKLIQTRIVKETTGLAGSSTESLRNIELIKALGLTEQEISRLNRITKKILGLELNKVKYLRTLGFIQGTCINLIRTALAFLLLYLVVNHKMQLGSYFSLFMFSFYVFNPLQEIGTFINVYREAEVSLKNFSNLMNSPVELKPTEPLSLGKITQLQFDSVSFQHQSNARKALNNISFEVKSGETIAFAGPSGSGKTTLIKLLVGLYHPLSGYVKYNGTDGKLIDIDKLREQIGLVSQDTQLFSGTLRENLLFVKPNASDNEMKRTLEKAACTSLMQRAAKGLDTIIGEGGIKVSGGEKQRISIARALLRNPNILVFDEATSALDSLTEEEITGTIRDISSNKQHITILIAHRLSTIMHADRIYVLEKGEIIEEGNHELLLQNRGLYAAMWRQQIGESKKESQKFSI